MWSLCKLKLGLSTVQNLSLEEEAHNAFQNSKGKSKTTDLARVVLSAAVWHIWKERNARIFLQKSTDKIMVFRSIYEDVNVLLQHAIGRPGTIPCLQQLGGVFLYLISEP